MAAQKRGGRAIWKVVLSRSGEDTKTYTTDRVLRISRIEEDDSHVARILLHNRDKALTSLNFEFYKCVISRGYKTSAGDEYSGIAPLWVIGQQFLSFGGELVCELMAVGIFDLMAMDLAEFEETPDEDDTDTIKIWLTAVANATARPFDNYTNFSITYANEDAIIDSFIPADYLTMAENADRRTIFNELLDWTSMKKRGEADEAIRIFAPKRAEPYDYEYKLAVADEHPFFSKTLRNRFVFPNKIVVKSADGHSPQSIGSATSSTSFALAPKTRTIRARLLDDDQANLIATARIESLELDAEKGSGEVPMNVGQELWDYIKITDSRENDNRVGNVRYISEECGSSPPVFKMTIRFGKLSGQSKVGAPTLGISEISTDALAAAIIDNINRISEIERLALRNYMLIVGINERLKETITTKELSSRIEKLDVWGRLTIPGVR